MTISTSIARANHLWGEDWHEIRQLWSLDFSVFLFSHGAYGAIPVAVRERQRQLLELVDRNPTGFFRRELMPLLEDARLKAAHFCGASPANFAWVRNATDGMTAAVNALPLKAGDELVITNHIYSAVRLAVEKRCAQTGASLVEAFVPLTNDDSELVESIQSKFTKRTRGLVIDEIPAPSARVFPVRDIAKITRASGIPLIVDGAHALGMYPVELETLGADMWVGNFHKWVCAPHSAAVLWFSPEWHDKVQPLSVSFRDKLDFPQNFGRLGTDDLTPALCVPFAIEFLDTIGASKIQEYNKKLAALGASAITNALRTDPVPGKFAARHPIALPSGIGRTASEASKLQIAIATELHAELSVVDALADEGHGYILISAFIYNHLDDFTHFAERLVDWLKENN